MRGSWSMPRASLGLSVMTNTGRQGRGRKGGEEWEEEGDKMCESERVVRGMQECVRLREIIREDVSESPCA